MKFSWVPVVSFLAFCTLTIGMLRNYNGPADGSPENMPAIYDRVIWQDPELAWDPAKFTPDVVCINLGTNDFSTSGVNQEKFAANYIAFAKMLIGRYPSARLVLLMGPMLNSEALKSTLAEVVESVNKESPEKVSLFELSAQGAHGFGADGHPSQDQAKINGTELTKYLSNLMNWPVESGPKQ